MRACVCVRARACENTTSPSQALPAIAAYMKTDKFLSRPVNNVTANFK